MSSTEQDAAAGPKASSTRETPSLPTIPLLSSIADLIDPQPFKPLISPTIYHSTDEGKSRAGAPLSGQTELIGDKLGKEIVLRDAPNEEHARATVPGPKKGHSMGLKDEIMDRTIPLGRGGEKRAIVTELLDAPARASLNLPNGATYHQQAAAVRNARPALITPEFEVIPFAAVGVLKNVVPLSRALFGSGRNSPSNAGAEGEPGSAGARYEEGAYASSSSVRGQGGFGLDGRATGELGDYFARLSGGEGLASGSAQRYGKGREDEGESLPVGSRSPSPNPGTPPSRAGIRGTLLKRIRIDRAASPTQHLLRPTFPPPSLSTYSPQPPRPLSLLEWVNLFFIQSASFVVSTVFLIVVVIWAVSMEISTQVPRWFMGKRKKQVFPWDDEKYWKKNEKVSKEPRDYARAIGMDIENQTIETEDGFFLRVNRVIDPAAQKHSDGRGGFPVLILHGLFQSSGSFITSEERSLAFWLAKQGGYQVYLGNTRGVFNMGHRNLSRSDPRFWDWTIRELAMYDMPALVEHVCAETGYDKIAFIGHSQGNGMAFISLSVGMCPSLGDRLSLFVALAPAVYAGPLTSGFPFTQLGKMEWQTWRRLFGVLDFIPLMRWSYDHVPSRMFAALGYVMFAYLFSWTDTNWLHRRKTKMFRFTPTPVSSASLFWWCGKGGFGSRKCIMDDTLDTWFDHRFPPLSIFYGGRDFLVLAEPLLDRLKNKEEGINLVRVDKLDVGEHCDSFWSVLAPEWTFGKLREDIEKTRPRYPEEIAVDDDAS